MCLQKHIPFSERNENLEKEVWLLHYFSNIHWCYILYSDCETLELVRFIIWLQLPNYHWKH